MKTEFLLSPILALILAPMLFGIINRTKAFFGGRQGQLVYQPYLDLWKLFHKGAVYSNVTTWIFRTSPVVGMAVAICAVCIIPLGKSPSLISFAGDLLVVAYLFGLMRFFTVIAAMDTGSAFEGMGASREVQFSALAEPALLLALAVVARVTGTWSLASMTQSVTPQLWYSHLPPLLLVIIGLFIVLLAENSRIPVDDPNTHLELTMIHEVMVLDHSGVDFGLITYGAALKMWALAALIVGLILPPSSGVLWYDSALSLGAMAAVAICVGIVESSLARLSLLRVPQLLAGASAMSLVGLLLL